MLFCGFQRESHAPGDHLVPDQGCARPQGTNFAVARRDGDDCRRLFGDYWYEPAALTCRIRIDDIAQQERILRRHDRIVDGGHGQPEVLQRLADLDRGRI